MADDAQQPELDALWREVRERLRASVPESTFKLWLEPLAASGRRGETLYLSAPDGVRAWVERRYASLIREALGGIGQRWIEVAREHAVGKLEPLTPEQAVILNALSEMDD